MHYPNFQRILRESLRLIVGEEVEARVEIGEAKDGSGVGGKTDMPLDLIFFMADFYSLAALCALMALASD